MERLEKLYGRRALLLKGAYCLFLPLLHVLATSGSLAESLSWLFLSTVLLGCLYTLPFWFTASAIRKAKKHLHLLRFIALDAGTCLLPAFVSALVYETVLHLTENGSSLDGLYTLLLFFILLPISGLFWLLYAAVNRTSHTRP
ncbi:MAG: hypothetical protein J1E00_06070 [Oscillospiraceae bacterium]|nr:hypothetical protein [Oscillospiraceae bacterium]